MADARLQTLPDTPLPAARSSQLFIERDTGGGVFVSEKATVKGLDNLIYTVVIASQPIAEGQALAANTTAGVFTLTLPVAPTAGDVVHVADYAGTFATNNCILARNGENIHGLASDLNLNIDNLSVTMTYIDATQGWRMT